MTTVEELYKKYETLDQAGAEAGKVSPPSVTWLVLLAKSERI